MESGAEELLLACLSLVRYVLYMNLIGFKGYLYYIQYLNRQKQKQKQKMKYNHHSLSGSGKAEAGRKTMAD